MMFVEHNIDPPIVFLKCKADAIELTRLSEDEFEARWYLDGEIALSRRRYLQEGDTIKLGTLIEGTIGEAG